MHFFISLLFVHQTVRQKIRNLHSIPRRKFHRTTRNLDQNKKIQNDLASPHPKNDSMSKFDKLLVANRGEIACRIIRTAKNMGIRTVVVYSTIDAHSKHVKLADEAICVGGPKPCDSYMNVERLLEAMKITGARALHPGYGFLAENYKFVELLERENLIFVGPSKESIRQMGDKLISKQVASTAGVSTIPGYNGIIENVDHCLEIAKDIGYPVMIKASAGGGGRGMRIAHSDRDIRKNYEAAAEEAQLAFGDNRLLLEAHIEAPRHIEIQILGDKYGNAVQLYERECSIQRRHQKIMEEAPSTILDPITRSLMGEQALALCRQIGYYSVGTVEFLVDAKKHFYFLEMNTRLQVEHPVTECLTGIDLVEQMLLVAQGHELQIKQEDVKLDGCAIEMRICAEDPYKNFGSPSTGCIFKYKEPSGVRCDSGVGAGDHINIYYDPLIAKVIVNDSTRNGAILKAKNALDSFILRGITNNIPLLRMILEDDTFIRSNITTNYLSSEFAASFASKQLSSDEKQILVANAAQIYVQDELRRRNILNSSTKILKNSSKELWDLIVEVPTCDSKSSNQNTNEIIMEQFHLEVMHNESELKKELSIKLEGNILSGFVSNLHEAIIHSSLSQGDSNEHILQLAFRRPDGTIGLVFKGKLYALKVTPKVAHDLMQYVTSKLKPNLSKEIKAPMPGLVKNVECKDGQQVIEGEVLCIIEAMKMQNSMHATRTGKIKHVHIKIGDRVSEDDVLIELE